MSEIENKVVETTEAEKVESPVLFKDILSEDLVDVKAFSGFLDKPLVEASKELAKSYKHAQSLIGKRVSELPQEELAELLPRLERLESADEYVNKLSGDFGDEFVGKYKEELFELGLNENQAKSYLKRHREALESQALQIQEKNAEALEASENALKEQFGLKYKVAMDLAARTAVKLGGSELYKKVFENEAKDPDMVNLLYKVGRETLSPETAIGDPGGLINSPSEARAELDKLKASPEYSTAILDRHHPKHAEMLSERDRLFKEIYG